ncbi:ribosomal protein L7/L12 [Clostridium aestuarii]|uniref:Ribosomal protein L7/L12 n=1 Tax=Clostridium aestuarii TaxID=338193 RepID=A0ABT4D0F9_9CLOT|nr:ribosomal protein L7/L12 [Clostridium aestuarii]MCY6483845.1 ribosomal protein L7/L12 [Clostridium aestuarii]
MLKSKVWKLWFFAAICFSFTGIMSLIGEKNYMGILYISLAALYFILSITNYKANNKSNEIKLSDTELQNMDIELIKLITDGKKIKAIKKYRMATGVGLKEANDHVDSLSEKI